MEINFFARDFVWSFSRLNTYDTCKYAFYLQYIEENRGINNAFGQFGTHMHNILEKYARQELEIFELLQEYENTFYNTVTEQFPPNKYKDLNESYYNQGYEYFEQFSGFEDCEILGVEKEVEFKIGEFKFKGFIDLVTKDKNSDISIVDHKTKSKLSKNEKEKYLKQMYLYCIPMYQELGYYPKYLKFNMVRFNDWVVEEFNIKKLEETKQWALDTINGILNEKDWRPKSSQYFCQYICGVRLICEYKG